MKKRLLAFAMAAVMALSLFTGCGKTKEVIENEIEEDKVEVDLDGSDVEYYYGIQVYDLDAAVLVATCDDGAGGTYVEEVGSYGWFGQAGGTLGQIAEEWGIVSIEPKCEGFDFLGWRGVIASTYEAEDGFIEFDETEYEDGKIFTTEEIMELELPEVDLTFYTVWDLVCTSCNEHKICTVYNIDGVDYYVCDDCYLDFELEMGL